MNRNEIISQYEISKPGYGDGYNVSLKLADDLLLVGFISNKEDAAIRIEQIREFGNAESNYHIYEMEEEESFYFMLSMNGSMSRENILASSDMFDSRSELESIIKNVVRESQTTRIIDSTEV
ncbi:hypothetical protein C4G66_RS23845 [Vibrio parahaemolyticus]|uniref:Uncharacterized protein n=1 Tax=Vibrio parahaemolyticus TaxID=670 RepID=A0AA47L570_VIBPH|nr:hypothetical protein [Vibrio parahaemolyticus]EIE1275312.1 hypothetical protein [Vibrio parahaemolyticus]EJG0989920.1 hypothetical protein [Vibrio parahaemolyticus]EJG1071797.1 hypothetical protein [Vibrio parahaemolyticus]ELA8113174.1 hypothetical protein [Vibrio parahaemolyticus]ELA8166980.1 hypothetical protein [Vibrio parahaemolyticus]